ncbi:MAG: PPOX class F420-dependent oxidoreductase [Acidimicrobiales bacterium]
MQPIPASYRDLLGAEFATLATVGTSGRPQQSTVWFLAEGDEVRLSLNDSRQKTINLQHNPAVSVLVTDPTTNYRYLELRGRAKVEPDPDYVFADKVGAKYGADLRQHDRPGEHRVVVTIAAERARGVDMRG